MRSAIIVATIQLAFFSIANAMESQSPKITDTPLPVTSAFTTTVRELSGSGRVVSDNRGGWRLEKRFHTGNLSSVEDQLGMVVEVVRDGRGRPIGLILGSHLAVEYVYPEDDGPWRRKVLYEAETRKILAEFTNDEVSNAHQAQRHPQTRTGSNDPMQAQPSAVGPSAEQLQDPERGRHIVSYIGTTGTRCNRPRETDP